MADGSGNGNQTQNASVTQGTSLKGRVAMVTGASRGIGRAVAWEMARNGAAVAINYRVSQALAESLAAEICAIGGQCMLIQGDVSIASEAQRVVKAVLDNWKRIDILVNNAGITRDRSAAQDDRGRLEQGDRRQPERHVLLHQRSRADHDRAKVRTYH